MNVKVSPKFQVVIPKEIRSALGIRAGMEVTVFQYLNRIEYIPIQPISSLRGFVKGIDTTVEREEDRV